MLRFVHTALAALTLLAVPLAARAQAPSHVALVIGNAAYETAPPLKTPAVDAEIVAETLRAAGYDVTELLNVRQSDIGASMRDFLDKAAAAGPDGVAFVYFSGYGARASGENYLVPVDAVITSEADVDNESFRLNDLLGALAQAPLAARIVILDAARDHKFGAAGAKPVPKGLAPHDAVPGLLLAYAAAPNALADDGDDDYSRYTGALVTAMRQPGADIEQILKTARVQVHQATKGAQTPWTASGLTVEVTLFAPAETPPPPAAMPEPPQESAPAPSAKKPQARARRDRAPVDRDRAPVDRDRPPTDADNPTPAGRDSAPPAILIVPGLGGFGIGIGR